MSYYIELDSSTRNRHAYANPHKYEVEPPQVDTWSHSTFATQSTIRMSVRVENVIIPYTDALLDEPRLYMDFHSAGMDDSNKVNCIDGNHRRAKFVLVLDKIQYDSQDAGVWIHYKACGMAQILRFQRGYPLAIEIFDRDGDTIASGDETDPAEDVDPTKQTYILLSLEPYANTPTRVDTYA